MKKILNFMSVACVALMMSSCYSSTVCVGNMSKTEPSKCVNVVHNPHFLGGLVGKKEVKAKAYVGNRKDYKIKRHQSFWMVCFLLSHLVFIHQRPQSFTFL